MITIREVLRHILFMLVCSLFSDVPTLFTSSFYNNKKYARSEWEYLGDFIVGVT